jgi:hypothetical protein
MTMLAATLLATAAASASAQYNRPYDGYRDRAPGGAEQECWNPRAGHFERLRPGEYQDDLDLRRCRMIGYEGNRYEGNRYERREWRERREECWNPRAGHFEEVRRGEYQDDLDLRRCRIMRD